ncbi:MAG TPA: cytochrome c3 family protein [Pirellulales bacterium]|jgi:predicted CXXCH cytochrome family protein
MSFVDFLKRVARRPSLAYIVASGVTLAAAWLLVSAPQPARVAAADPPKQLDSAAWGKDHVGQELPEYMESGECLFCHREEVGKTWPRNKHNRTIREAVATEPAMEALTANEGAKAIAAEVTLLMGDTRAARFLRRSKDYGKLELLSVDASYGRTKRAKLDHTENPHWDVAIFAKECAGCHATAVDPKTHAFAAVALDCYTCHGDAPAEHANDSRLMPLAKKRKDSAAAVTSICASCHVRFGKSKSSGLPYPNNFVAGDNLFKDFQVDLALADDPKLNPGDRHVLDNIRDVVVNGKETMTCLSCHDIHNNSSKKHRDAPDQKYCLHCHEAGKPKTEYLKYEVHSDRCRY